MPNEPERLIIGGYGDGYDFFTMKGAIVELLKALRISDYEISAFTGDSLVPESRSFHPGRKGGNHKR